MILLSILLIISIPAWNIFSSSQDIDPKDEFKKYVALVHERYDTGVDVIFPWLPLKMMKNYYVNLTLVKDHEHGISMEDDDGYSSQLQYQMKKIAVGLEQLFNAEIRAGDRVLVRGPPGIGKTKLCEVLRTKWNEPTLLQSCEVLIHIPLRKLSVIDSPNLSDLLNFAGEVTGNPSFDLIHFSRS